MRPTHRIVVVGLRPAELVEPVGHEPRRLDVGQAVEVQHLVVGAVDRALGRGAVVVDDVEHQRVVEHTEALQAVDEPADVVVGVFQKARVDLHLPA
ncbi:Uncharacterised protein [Mycobacterium tuberculosis]|nr:Uncharacterised protein [Mycobacterium tuberculosis]